MKKEKRRFVIREKNLKKKHVAIFLTRSVVEIRSSICGFFYFFSFFPLPFFPILLNSNRRMFRFVVV